MKENSVIARSTVACLAIALLTVLFNASAAYAQKETVVYSFNPSGDGVGPVAGVITDSQGNIYGTTVAGGTSNAGTVFEISGGNEKTLYSFTGKADGGQPYGGVVRDSQGNLYGTTLVGGLGLGTVYKVTPDGSESVLVNFSLTNGGVPFGGLIIDKQGNLYGMTSGGGAHSLGVIFKVTSAGTFTLLYSFKGAPDAAIPQGQLVMDTKGNLYGLTSGGGTGTASYCKGGCGTVFELTAAGQENVLYSFQGGADGGTPAGGSFLILDSKGNLYGTATSGGTVTSACPNGCGVVFGLSSAGEKVLWAFKGGSDGQFPYSGLIRDGKGNLYGTTPDGGSQGKGIIYEITTAGKEKVLYNFPANSGDGYLPFGWLASDGKNGAYGTTTGGGQFGAGTVYHIAP